MKISTNYNNFTLKNNSILKPLMEVIPNTKVCKNLRVIDRNTFSAYVFAKDYRLGITIEDLKEVFKLDGDEFINASFNFLAKKLCIPEELLPQIITKEEETPNKPFVYIPSQNIILKSKDLGTDSRHKIFGYLRHELQHLIQNLFILRHETLGIEAIETYVEKSYDLVKDAFQIHLNSGISVDEFIKKYVDEEWVAEVFKKLKTNQEKNGDANIDQELSFLREEFGKDMEEYRDLVIKKMGIIKADSFDAKKSELFFNEFKDVGYYDSEGNIDAGKYIRSIVENDALMAGLVSDAESRGKVCLFKKMKEDSIESILNLSEQDAQSIKKVLPKE